jgi:hypothetical protein
MSSSPCGEDFTCEECGYMKACDIYYREKGFELLETSHEENWHEMRYAEKVTTHL